MAGATMVKQKLIAKWKGEMDSESIDSDILCDALDM